MSCHKWTVRSQNPSCCLARWQPVRFVPAAGMYKVFLQSIFIRSSRIFDLTRTTLLLALPRTKIEEDHSEEDQCEVDGFAAEVLFLENKGGEEETDYDAAAAYHGNDGNHRAWH